MSTDSSTVFRFVTVRNPRKPDPEEIEAGFIRYDPKIGSQVVEAHATKTRDEALAVARKYKGSPDFAKSEKEIAGRQPQLLAFADWLAAQADRITQDTLKQQRDSAKIAPDARVLSWLWDNLATHVLAGGRPEVREAIVACLRVYNLLAQPKPEKLPDSKLRRLASATVLMPPVPTFARGEGNAKKREEGKGPAPEAPPADTMRDAVEKANALRNAADELSRHLRDEADRARAAPRADLQVPRIADGCAQFPPEHGEREKAGRIPHEALVITQARLHGFSKGTQTALRETGIEVGARIPHAVDRLHDRAAQLMQAAIGGRKAEQRLVRVGRALWTAAPPMTHQSPAPDPRLRLDDLYADFFGHDRDCRVRPLGIADYRRVEQRLYCYEPGEVAHIENVMQGETKERVTRSLRRTEETITVSTEEETTKERDTQTTDRFEIEKETSKVVDTELKLDIGVQVQAQYGPVKIQADTKFATSYSTKESDKQASKYGKDVTDRALERIVTKKKEERITKIISEYEETNKHGLKGGDNEHVVGLFRWVDKIYEARIVNYGKRLMFEFLVPEPGAFHLYAMTKDPIASQVTLTKPIDPRSPELQQQLNLAPLTSHESINESNYAAYAAAYEAKVEPPPPAFLTTSKAYNREGMDQSTQFSDSKTDLKVPDGYEPVSFVAPFGFHKEGDNWVTLGIGSASQFYVSGGTFHAALAGEDDIVPVIVMGKTRMYALSVEVLCARSGTAMARWQLKTFNAILDAYETKLAAYNNALAEVKASTDIEMDGTNPDTNRQREQIELKKSSIRLLAQHCRPLWSAAMKDDQECHYPEFDCCEAIRDGSYVQFVEQCFEWGLMTYLFYPYFWGRKCNWKKIYQLDDADPLFLAFLQAGFARVVVPVRPGYENAALRFLADGTLWNGGEIPGVDDPLYVSIVNEMKEPVGEVDPSVEPWMIRVPTTLSVLQCDSGCTPGQGLPCPGPNTPWP